MTPSSLPDQARATWVPIVVGLVLTLSVAGALSAAIETGTILVQVQSPNHHRVSIRVPTLFVQIGAAAIPDAVFEDVSAEFDEWGPGLLELLDDLAARPDFEIVRIESRDEDVSIQKRGPNVEIRVESPNERVRVRLPIGVARNVIRRIERAKADI